MCQSGSETFFNLNYSEAEEKNYAPCADLCKRYLANGWQVKENSSHLKPVDASTFGHVIEKVFPNVTKTK